MTKAVLVAVVIVLMAAMVSANSFADFKRLYNKTYHSAQEEAFRRVVFETNMVTAAKLQAQNPHAKFGMSPFADLTEAEFKLYNRADYTPYLRSRKPTPVDTEIAPAAAFDWRKHGAVTSVKNQGACGSCWAFSAVGNIEGQWFLAGHKLISLSEQELVSCDTIDAGCRGGIPVNAYTYLLEFTNGTIASDASYPYVSGNKYVPQCRSPPGKVGAQIDGYKDIPSNETDMMRYVFANGPISIGVHASKAFQHYTSGILTYCGAPGQLDHGILIVGYNLTHSPPYWIVKNQWGTSWGENGYIRIAYGTNECGLNEAPTSVLVKRAAPAPPRNE